MSDAEQERAAIVAWLRSWADELGEDAICQDDTVIYARAVQLINAAMRIERRNHLRSKSEGDS